MTKQELLDILSTHNDIGSKAKAGRVLDFIKSTIIEELANGNEVALGQDFGTFKPVTKAARSGVAMGKPYNTPASKGVKFSPSTPFKRAINS
jgi:nucleoid DNA-binding protein